jgi:hypothetical protein
MREATEPMAWGSNQGDFADMRVHRHEIYQMRPILAANSGEGGRNRGRGGACNPVAGARARGGKGGAARRLVGRVRPSHPVGFDQVAWRPTGGIGADRWARGPGGPGEALNYETNKGNPEK